MSSQSLDDLVKVTEHAEPLHPLRALFRHHFYLDGLVNTEGGLWLIMMNALLIVPLIMAAFSYPLHACSRGRLLLVSLAGYEGYLFWRRRRLKPDGCTHKRHCADRVCLDTTKLRLNRVTGGCGVRFQ